MSSMMPTWRHRIGLLCMLATILSASSAKAEQSGSTPSRDERVRLVEVMLDREPSSSSVIQEAMRYFELHPEDILRFQRTLRSKAGAPYFVVSERYQNNSIERDFLNQTPDRVQILQFQDRFQAQRSSTTGILSWDTPIGVMAEAEFQTYQLALVQRTIISAVNGWIYSRRILMIELLVDPPRDPRALTSLRVRVNGFTALLNLYTGGWYEDQLPEIPEALRTALPGSTPDS